MIYISVIITHITRTGPVHKKTRWRPFVWYSNSWAVFKWYLKTRPFGIQPLIDHLNTRLVQYSDPHCIIFCLAVSFGGQQDHAKVRANF